MRALSLLSGAALSAAVLTGCDSGVTEPPFLPETSPTPTVTATPEAAPTMETTATPDATPTVTPADLESFRAFAPQIEAALKARDVDFFMDVAVVSTAVCGEPGYLPSLLCDELPPGTTIEGVWTGGWRSEGFLATDEEFRHSLEEYLASLGKPTLYAIAALDHYIGGLIGGPAIFAIVASADDPPNSTRVFEFVEEDERWRMPNVILVPNLADEWLSGGCSDCYDRWERWEGTQ